MSTTELPPGGASAHQMIVRYTKQLQTLIQTRPDETDVNFRTSHEVASRIVQAAYAGWKNAEFRKIAPHEPTRRSTGGLW